MNITIKIDKNTLNKIFPVKEDEYLIGMLDSGAKIYKTKQNGYYRISGYAFDGSDVIKGIKQIMKGE